MALLLAVILNLLGSATAYGECNPYWGKGCSVDGGWSAWDDWSACSAACAGGTQSRSRTCTSPKPEQGGAQCAGEEEEERACNTEPCKTEVLQFNGTHRDWVQVTTEVVGNSSNLSICTWFKLTDVSQNWNTFLEYKFAEYERITLYYIRYSIEDIPVLGFSVGGESQSIEANMEGKIVVDKWYHVCITQQPVEGPSIFLDGERVFTASAGIVTELEDFSYPLSGRLVAGQVSDSSTFVDAYKNNPGLVCPHYIYNLLPKTDDISCLPERGSPW